MAVIIDAILDSQVSTRWISGNFYYFIYITFLDQFLTNLFQVWAISSYYSWPICFVLFLILSSCYFIKFSCCFFYVFPLMSVLPIACCHFLFRVSWHHDWCFVVVFYCSFIYRVGHKKLCIFYKTYFPQMLEFSQDFFLPEVGYHYKFWLAEAFANCPIFPSNSLVMDNMFDPSPTLLNYGCHPNIVNTLKLSITLSNMSLGILLISSLIFSFSLSIVGELSW